MNLKDLSEQLNKHVMEESKVWEKVQADLTTIKDNHLAHIEPDVAGLKEDMSEIKEKTVILGINQGWIMKIGSLIGGALLAGMIKLIFFS